MHKDNPNDKGEVKLLYIAVADSLQGWSKIGITGKTFAERWKGWNKGNPPLAERKEYFSIRLPRVVAEAVENHIKAKFVEPDDGEWVEWPPSKLRAVVIGLLFEYKEVRRDLERVVDGRRQRDYVLACEEQAPLPVSPPASADESSSSETECAEQDAETAYARKKKFRKCISCGGDLGEDGTTTRCRPCADKVRDYLRKRRAAEREDRNDEAPDVSGSDAVSGVDDLPTEE